MGKNCIKNRKCELKIIRRYPRQGSAPEQLVEDTRQQQQQQHAISGAIEHFYWLPWQHPQENWRIGVYNITLKFPHWNFTMSNESIGNI